MEKLNVNPRLADGDLLELSPFKIPSSILKPSQTDNLVILQTPVQKHLTVSFLTPKAMLGTRSHLPQDNENMSVSTPIFQQQNAASIQQIDSVASGSHPENLCTSDTKSRITSRRVGVSSCAMLDAPIKTTALDFTHCTAGSMDPTQNGATTWTDVSEAKWDSLRQLDEDSHWKEGEVTMKLDDEEVFPPVAEDVNGITRKVARITDSKSSFPATSSLPVSDAVSVRNSDVIFSPIAKVSVMSGCLAPGSEIMTPMSKGLTPFTANTGEIGRTFDVAYPASFYRQERPCVDPENVPNGNALVRDLSRGNEEDKVSVRNLGPVIMKQNNRSNTRKTQSVSDEATVRNWPKAGMKIECRSHSADRDYVKDPFPPSQHNPLTAVEPKSGEVYSNSLLSQNSNATSNLSTPVFSTLPSAKEHHFAMRPVDVVFGNEDFTDSTSLLNQGALNLDLDYLDQKTSGAISSDLRKQSLFVKFDPLLEGIGGRQSVALLGRKSDIIDFSGRVTPVSGDKAEESIVSPRELDLLCDSPLQDGVEGRTFSESLTARGSEEDDSAGSASSGLQSSAGNTAGSGIIEVLQYSEKDVQRILSRRKEKHEKEIKASINEQNRMKKQLQELKINAEINEAWEKAAEFADENVQFENEISTKRKEKQDIDAKRSKLSHESSELFRKTDILQKLLMSHQTNEINHNEHAKVLRQKSNASQKKILDLEAETTEKLNCTRAEVAAVKSNMAAQLHSLEIKMKAVKLRLGSLQSTLDNQKKENRELVKICDELVKTGESR